jgi:hypothetical protein
LDRENEEDCLGSSVKNQLRLAIVETKFSWEWGLPETADEADGSYALSLRRSVYMSFTNRTTGVSSPVCQFLERVDAGGEKKLLELLAKASAGQHSRRTSSNPSGEES